VNGLLDLGVLFAFAAGRYHNLRIGERTLLLVDMRASTPIAARIDQKRQRADETAGSELGFLRREIRPRPGSRAVALLKGAPKGVVGAGGDREAETRHAPSLWRASQARSHCHTVSPVEPDERCNLLPQPRFDAAGAFQQVEIEIRFGSPVFAVKIAASPTNY